MEQLEKDFTSLVQSKVLLSLTQPSKMNALKALLNESNSDVSIKKDKLSATPNKESSKQVWL